MSMRNMSVDLEGFELNGKDKEVEAEKVFIV